MTIYFAPIGSGIGDVLVCKPACEWLVREHSDPVYFVARGPRQVGLSKLLNGVAGEITELELGAQWTPQDRLINLRDHHLQRHHDWCSREFKGRFSNLRISQVLDLICADLRIAADNSEIVPLPFTPDERSRGKVILVPATTMKQKMLKNGFWLNLFKELKQQHKDCLLLGSLNRSSETQSLVDAGIPFIRTDTLQEAINLISNAQAVVSVDTGLMHIAVQQGVRTIVLFGPCELYYRPAPHCMPIFTDAKLNPKQSYLGYPVHNFPAVIDNWSYFPADADAGEYIEFDDHLRVIELLGLE